jgi:arylsulfatase A-like enzyme
VLTLAESFQAAGFRTAAFVSGVALRDKRGLDQGFELWQYRFGDTPTLALATEWLAARDPHDAKPLFIWIHLSGADPPHDPRALPPKPGDEPGAFDFGRYFEDPAYSGPADGSLKVLDAAERGELTLSAADRAHLVDLYDGEVTRVASGVRSLLLFLRNQGDDGALWRDTAFVFAGLHGIELGEHGSSWSHARSLSECVLRVPLFVRHPGSLTGARVLAEVVGLEDLAPTLCEWFHTQAPNAPPGIASGRTLLALTDSFVKRPFASRPAIAVLSGPQRAASLRTREWSVLWSAAPAGSAAQDAFHLFDRVRDPLERSDLAARHMDVGTALSAELERAFVASGWER